jgi:PhzF family phenazine biosynthesis protein
MTAELDESVLEIVRFREGRPTDIPAVADIEKDSYPEDEAASKSTLQYRQHHAAPYFRCAVVEDEDDDDNSKLVGYICSTRCREFEHESMSTHVFNAPLLAIHSVVVQKEYRHKGIATAMLKDYVEQIRILNDGTIEKLVLLAKKDLLAFYVDCGFQVMRPSAIVHGSEQWYDLELDLLTFGQKAGSPCYIVDAFADPEKSGTGNQAAVVLLKSDVDVTDERTLKWMQDVAQEFNLSETAFVWPGKIEKGSDETELPYHIRYFTPKVEVALCGHATLASAAVVYQTTNIKNKNEAKIVFRAKEDVLLAELALSGQPSSSGRLTRITMEFPSKPAKALEKDEDIKAVHEMLKTALKVSSESILFVGLSDIGDLLIELVLESFQAIGYDNLDYGALLAYEGYSRGMIICCQLPVAEVQDDQSDSGQTIDFLSRFFIPRYGINEDPVTGSAHCVLAPYFCEKLGKTKIIGQQMSQRGGFVECTVDKGRVKMTGSAVTSMDGTLRMCLN